MDAHVAGATSRFSDRVLRFLKRVEHRVAEAPAAREAVYRLRYEAYIRNGLIEPRADGRLYDERYDEAPDAWITTTFIDGELAATTRVNLGADENAILPSFAVYPDVIAPYLRAGRVIIESTRTAARLDLAGRFPELPYVTLRPAYLASEHFDADFVVATARAAHMAFFRRVFRFEPWCEPRDYPDFTAKVACMGADFRAVQEGIEARYPFFRSTAAEREALFGPLREVADAPSRATSGRRRFEAQASAAF
jgi:hypothetical protein